MKKHMKKYLSLLMAAALVVPSVPAKAWVADNGDGTFTNPVMWGDYPDNDVIRVGDTYYMSSTSMHLFPACPVMSSKDLVNWEYESYALSEEEALRLANNDDGLTLKNGRSVYDMGPWATSLRYSEKLKKFYLLVNMQDGVDAEYAVLCVADKASGPWKSYRLDNPEGAIKGLYDPGLFFDKDPVTGEENGDVWVIHGQGALYATKLNVVSEETGELAIDEEHKNIPLYNYTGGGYNEGSHAYKFGDTYYIISTPTWNGTPSKKSIAIQTKDLVNGPYEVKDIMTSFMNFGQNGIHQGGIVDVPQEDGTSEWWSIIFQDRNKLGRVPTLQPVYWETDENGLKWPMMGVQGKNGEQAAVTMTKPNTGAVTKPQKPADSDEFDSAELGNHWQWNHVSDPSKWSLTERPGFMRLHTATVTNTLTTAQNTLRQRVVGPESAATIKMDISNMADGDVAGLSVIQRNYNYIGVTTDGETKRVVINDDGKEQISEEIPADTTEIWFRASTPRFEYRTEFSYSLDGENFKRLGGRYDMRYGNYVGMGFGAFNFATKELGGYVDVDYFHMDMPDDHGNYNTLNEKIEAERYDLQSYDISLGQPSRDYNPLTEWTADYAYTDTLANWGGAYDLAVGNFRNGNWVEYNRVDFKDGADWLNFRVAGTKENDKIEVRLNDAKGELLTTVDVPNTGDLESYQNVIVPLETSPKGLQKICLVYKGENTATCRINWFMAGTGEQPEAPAVPENLQAKSVGESQIEFAWDDVAGAESYDLKIGDEIISNVTSPFVKTGIPEGALYKVTVRAKNYGGYSEWSEGVKASTEGNPYRIPQNTMSLPKFSSEERGGEGPKSGYISAILDGDAGTFWHSAWSSGNAQPPHWFVLDLGNSYEVNKLSLLPRQGSGDLPNGLFRKVSVSYSNTGLEDGDFTTVVDKKALPAGTASQTIDFAPVTARYLKVYVDEGHNGFASLAEVEVFRTNADDTKPTAPANVTANVRWENEKPAVVLNWEAAEDKESGIKSYSVFRDGKFVNVTNELTFTDKSIDLDGTYHYEIVATNGAGLDGEAAVLDVTVVAPPKTYKIPQETMAATASSEETIDEPGTGHGFAKNAIDGKADTFWCTQWSDKNPDGKLPGPHWIQIDLGETYTLDHVEFLQRALSNPHGQVTEYSVSYSEDGENYTTLVDHGTWSLDDQSNTVAFGGVKARYVKLDCHKGQGGYVPAAMAEINAYAVEEAEMPEADKIELAALIDYAQSQQEAEEYKYLVPVVKAAFEKALAEAVAINADEKATQEAVDAAYEKLLEMVGYLDFTGNSESLKVLIDAAKALNEKLYTQESWAVLEEALANAETVFADENALQAEIDAARDALQTAMDALEENPVDKTKLQKLVEKSKKYEDKIAEYTPATAEIFEGALAHARDILVNDATQEEIDAAYAALQNAIFGLRLIPDKGKLEDLIKDAEAVDTADYTAESAAAFTAALDNAKAVFADANATEEQVKAAEKALKKAQKNLVAKADAGEKGDDKVASADGSEKQADKAAKTGDASQAVATMMAMLMAGFAAVLSFRRKRR